MKRYDSTPDPGRALLLAPLLMLFACGGSETTPASEAESPDAETCEHFSGGPFQDSTATEAVADAPEVSAEHTAHRISLPETMTAGERAGYVKLPIGGAGDYILFTSEDAPLAVADSSENPIAPKETASGDGASTECATVKGRHVVALGVGTYYVKLGPTSVAKLLLTHEEAAAIEP